MLSGREKRGREGGHWAGPRFWEEAFFQGLPDPSRDVATTTHKQSGGCLVEFFDVFRCFVDTYFCSKIDLNA